MSETTIENDKPWEKMPAGEWAIVELFGHTTLVGRISEVERFGAKMMAIECLFNGALLEPVFHGGAAIYRMTPCQVETAWKRQPRNMYNLPPSIQNIVPVAALPAPKTIDPDDDQDVCQTCFGTGGGHKDGCPEEF